MSSAGTPASSSEKAVRPPAMPEPTITYLAVGGTGSLLRECSKGKLRVVRCQKLRQGVGLGIVLLDIIIRR